MKDLEESKMYIYLFIALLIWAALTINVSGEPMNFGNGPDHSNPGASYHNGIHQYVYEGGHWYWEVKERHLCMTVNAWVDPGRYKDPWRE